MRTEYKKKMLAICPLKFRSYPEAHVFAEHESGLSLKPRQRTKQYRGSREQNPLQHHPNMFPAAIFGRSWRKNKNRKHCRRDQAQHGKGHNRSGQNGQIERQDRFVELVAPDDYRQPAQQKNHDCIGRPGPKTFKHRKNQINLFPKWYGFVFIKTKKKIRHIFNAVTPTPLLLINI